MLRRNPQKNVINENGVTGFQKVEFGTDEATAHDQRDLIHLNVGGRRFTTLLDTISSSKSAYFENFLHVEKSTGKVFLLHQRFLKDESGAVFVNRDGDLFAHVLQFMRDRKKTVLPRDASLLAQLKREADFFGMEEFKQFIIEILVNFNLAENKPYESLVYSSGLNRSN